MWADLTEERKAYVIRRLEGVITRIECLAFDEREGGNARRAGELDARADDVRAAIEELQH